MGYVTRILWQSLIASLYPKMKNRRVCCSVLQCFAECCSVLQMPSPIGHFLQSTHELLWGSFAKNKVYGSLSLFLLLARSLTLVSLTLVSLTLVSLTLVSLAIVSLTLVSLTLVSLTLVSLTIVSLTIVSLTIVSLTIVSLALVSLTLVLLARAISLCLSLSSLSRPLSFVLFPQTTTGLFYEE